MFENRDLFSVGFEGDEDCGTTIVSVPDNNTVVDDTEFDVRDVVSVPVNDAVVGVTLLVFKDVVSVPVIDAVVGITVLTAECKKCKRTAHQTELNLHHKDGDSSNDDWVNIVIYCRACHNDLEGTVPRKRDK